MNRFNKLLINVPILSFSPVLFVVSCGENVASDSNYQKEITNKFQNSFIEFPNLITTKNIGLDVIKNFVTFTSWSSVDELLGANFLGKYFTINNELNTLLTNNNFEIYKNIKKVVIQPQENTKNLTIIFNLFNSSNDSNIVSYTVLDALNTNFVYENMINISLNSSFKKYQNAEAFNQEWSKISDPQKCTENDLKSFLEKIFTSTTANWTNKIFTAYQNNKIQIRNSNYKITIQLLTDAINEGYIFDITSTSGLNTKDVFFTSQTLINN